MALTAQQKEANIGFVIPFLIPLEDKNPIPRKNGYYDYEAFEVDEYRLGETSGGASITYTPTYTESSGDSGIYKESYLSKEELEAKTGLITNIAPAVARLCPTAKMETDENGITVLKIGGLANAEDKKYILHLKHISKDIRYTMLATSTSAITLTFKDTAEPMDATFKAVPQDDGVLLEIVRDWDANKSKLTAQE